MAVDDETLSKLLRQKRNEQPPPEYFDNFLREFQQRQRAEMLRRPAWRLGWERLVTRLAGLRESFAIPQLSYAGASAAVVALATIFTVQMLQHPGGGRMEIADGGASAENSGSANANAIQGSSRSMQVADGGAHLDRFTLNAQFRMPEVRFQEREAVVSSPSQPRYILDTRPASYEASYSF